MRCNHCNQLSIEGEGIVVCNRVPALLRLAASLFYWRLSSKHCRQLMRVASSSTTDGSGVKVANNHQALSPHVAFDNLASFRCFRAPSSSRESQSQDSPSCLQDVVVVAFCDLESEGQLIEAGACVLRLGGRVHMEGEPLLITHVISKRVPRNAPANAMCVRFSWLKRCVKARQFLPVVSGVDDWNLFFGINFLVVGYSVEMTAVLEVYLSTYAGILVKPGDDFVDVVVIAPFQSAIAALDLHQRPRATYTVHWIFDCLTESQLLWGPAAIDSVCAAFHRPLVSPSHPLRNLVISVTGFADDDRLLIREMVLLCGAQVS
jgi:hypothetical protein